MQNQVILAYLIKEREKEKFIFHITSSPWTMKRLHIV